MADQTKHTDESHAHASSKHTDESHAHASSKHANKNTEHKSSGFASSVPSSDQLEKKMDTFADDLTHKIEESISPELTSKGKHIFDSFDRIIDQLEGFIVDLIGLIPVPGNTSKNTYMINADYQASVSRLFIFRLLRLIVQYPIMIVWSTWISVIFVLQLCNMLLFGKRNQNLRNRIYRFILHSCKRSAYIVGFVDQRPAILVKLDS